MSVHEASVRFKIGDLELEYRGSSSFIEDGLMELFEKALSYRNFQGKRPRQAAERTADQSEESSPRQVESDISLATMISRLGAETGPDVVFMAAAHLVICQGMSRFSRADILKNAKLAEGYYKKSISSNLTSYLGRLLRDGRLSQYSDSSYSLPASQRQSVQRGLADNR